MRAGGVSAAMADFGAGLGSPPKAQLVVEERFARSGGGVKGLHKTKAQTSAGELSPMEPGGATFHTLGLRSQWGGVSDAEKGNAGATVLGETSKLEDDGMRSRGSSASSTVSMYDLSQRLRASSLDTASEDELEKGGLSPEIVAAERESLEALMGEGYPVINARFRRRRRKSILGMDQENALMSAGHSPHAFAALVDECEESMFDMDMQ